MMQRTLGGLAVALGLLVACANTTGAPADRGKVCSSSAECEVMCVVSCDGGTAGTCDRATAENCNRQCSLGSGGTREEIPCAH